MNEDATKNNMKVASLKFSSISRISLTQTFSCNSIFGLEACAGKYIYRFMFLQWMVQEKGRGSSISGNLWISYEERWRGDRFLHNALRAGSKWHRQVVTGCKTLHESSCHLTSPSTTLWWWPWSTSVAVTQLFNGSSLLPKDFGDILCLADFGRRVNSEERLQRYCNRLSFVLTPPQIILLRETSKTRSAFDTEKKASDWKDEKEMIKSRSSLKQRFGSSEGSL